MAVSHELGLPILRVGVGEGIEDLQPFDAREYAEALFGEMRAELDGDEEGGDLSTSVSDDTSGRDDMPEPEEAPSVISSEEPEATPSVISSEESRSERSREISARPVVLTMEISPLRCLMTPPVKMTCLKPKRPR